MALPMNALTAPLGQTPRPVAQPHRLATVVPALIVGLLSTALLSFGAFALIANDPLGGEPVARASAKIKPTIVASRAQATDAPAEPATAAAPQPARQTISIINGLTGARNEVEIGGAPQRTPNTPAAPQRQAEAAPPPGTMRIQVAPDGAVKITPADTKQASEIKRYMDAQKPAANANAKVINVPQ